MEKCAGFTAGYDSSACSASSEGSGVSGGMHVGTVGFGLLSTNPFGGVALMAESDAELLIRLVARCQTVMAHAWMVRTFVKHSDEAEDFPELMNLVRSVFDISRALETRVAEPAAYFKMLGKKIGKLRAAAVSFRDDAPKASSHTNFVQAVISLNACVEELTLLLKQAQPILPRPQSPPQAISPSAETSDD